MGSFRTSVNFDGKDYDCLFVQYGLTRNIDDKGRVSSGVKGGVIKLRIESTEDSTVIQQMINKQFTPFNGKITYMKSDEEGEMKSVEWQNGYVIGYTETFDADNDQKMSIFFTVSAEIINFAEASQDNRWPKA